MTLRGNRVVFIAATAIAAGACGGNQFTGGDGTDGGSDANGGSSGTAGASSGGATGTGGGGTGGSTDTGGAVGSGGDPGSGGSGTGGAGGSGGGPVSCTAGTVKFQMIAGGPANDTGYCIGLGCGGDWLSVKTADGAPVPLGIGCTTDCERCTPIACTDACAAPRHMKPEGEVTSWDGTFWKSSTCGAGLACGERLCMNPGSHLIARMCAYPSTNPDGSAYFCESTNQPTCVEVPFDYPSANVVTGVLNPTR
jgi:hypothetical protein